MHDFSRKSSFSKLRTTKKQTTHLSFASWIHCGRKRARDWRTKVRWRYLCFCVPDALTLLDSRKVVVCFTSLHATFPQPLYVKRRKLATVRPYYTPQGHLGGWATPRSAEKILHGQCQGVDIPAHARTHNGLLLTLRRPNQARNWTKLNFI